MTHRGVLKEFVEFIGKGSREAAHFLFIDAVRQVFASPEELEDTSSMRSLIRILFVLFAATLPVAHGQSLADQFAAGQNSASTSPQATVIVYRASSMVGGLYKPSVFDENGEILRMRNGRFVTLTVKPGTHTFTSTLAGNKVMIEAKAGETYYVCFTLATYSQYGTFKGQVTQVEAGQAKAEVAKLKPVDAGEMVRK